MTTVPILFTFDDKLILPACVAISSLLQNAKPETFYDIYIIHSDQYDLSATQVASVASFFPNCRLTFRPVAGEFVGGYEIRGIPETCYYRMLAPELIPEYEKILYSDVDVIFREDLSKYYELDLGTSCFAGVDNGSSLRPDVQDYVTNTLKIDASKGYYYSGNLVINLKVLREEGFCDKFRELGLLQYKQQDMDIINVACNGRFLSLGPSFCLTIQLYDMILERRSEVLKLYDAEELDNALSHGIIHYNGAKPWNTWCHHFDFWWESYRKSPFFDEQFYSNFYMSKAKELDNLSLIKRIKLLLRYFYA